MTGSARHAGEFDCVELGAVAGCAGRCEFDCVEAPGCAGRCEFDCVEAPGCAGRCEFDCVELGGGRVEVCA